LHCWRPNQKKRKRKRKEKEKEKKKKKREKNTVYSQLTSKTKTISL